MGFFGTNFQSQSRPVSFPVDPPGSQQGSVSPSFVNFNNFRAPEERPRSLSGANSGSQFQNRNNLNTFSDEARFDIRPSPTSQSQLVSPSFPAQRPDPPSPVFQLSPSPPRSRSQSRQVFPSFPQPQFGGFRPIKRHLHVEEGKEELFIEDLVNDERSKRQNKQNKKHKSHRSNQKKKSDFQGESADIAEARQHMQDALNKGLAKVYYEEFIQKNNYIDYYDYYENYPDYYYDYSDYYI